MQAIALVADVLLDARRARRADAPGLQQDARRSSSGSAKRLGGAITLVDDGDHAALAAAIRPETRFVFAETFTNPLVRAQDIPALRGSSRRAHGRPSAARDRLDDRDAVGVRTPLLAQGVDVVARQPHQGARRPRPRLGGYIATNDADSATRSWI